ncbi:hypothetical protein [Croceicoccus gelatinilyticus]|uniref:hypothetical protein n=1 Tax=Croceicoccus gelatinilyticus TaxID=2835536 RepID=UPI001BCEAA83|nr:hypothetical protein [Croceicoccus gelatinilyticus]MBS7668120.1 hypothetical protein [Croceicoccus gelatinilyticus]
MDERDAIESGEPIDRPPIYRIVLIAFLVWSSHFIVSYGAALIFPEQAIARWIAGAAMLLAFAALVVRARRPGWMRDPMALGALGLALAGIIFGTLPAVVG